MSTNHLKYHNPFCEEPNPHHFRAREDTRRLFAELIKVNDEQRITVLFEGYRKISAMFNENEGFFKWFLLEIRLDSSWKV